jgi:hypothetical protein
LGARTKLVGTSKGVAISIRACEPQIAATVGVRVCNEVESTDCSPVECPTGGPTFAREWAPEP